MTLLSKSGIRVFLNKSSCEVSELKTLSNPNLLKDLSVDETLAGDYRIDEESCSNESRVQVKPWSSSSFSMGRIRIETEM